MCGIREREWESLNKTCKEEKGERQEGHEQHTPVKKECGIRGVMWCVNNQCQHIGPCQLAHS